MTDLHMHSRFSEDGEFTPSQLMELFHNAGAETVALTDHDTVAGVSEAKEAAERQGLNFITGIEIDCCLSGADFHILGYGIDITNDFFAYVEQNYARQFGDASDRMLAKLNAMGLYPKKQDLDRIAKDSYWKGGYYHECFGQALLENPDYADEPLLEPFRPGGKYAANPLFGFYLAYFSQGAPCYVKTEFPEVGEVIRGIHSAGGLAIVAHPANNIRDRHELLDELCDLGIDGFEAFSSYHTLEQNQYYFTEAKRRGLLVSVGSDFHGKVKPAIAPCSTPYDREAVEETLRVLFR